MYIGCFDQHIIKAYQGVILVWWTLLGVCNDEIMWYDPGVGALTYKRWKWKKGLFLRNGSQKMWLGVNSTYFQEKWLFYIFFTSNWIPLRGYFWTKFYLGENFKYQFLFRGIFSSKCKFLLGGIFWNPLVRHVYTLQLECPQTPVWCSLVWLYLVFEKLF